MPTLYDTIFVQEPLRQDPFAVTHNPSDTSTLIDVYKKSSKYFIERDRRRAVERLQYELGKLYMREREWEKGLKVLEPLWRASSWRREGWWELLALLVEAVRECAQRLENKEVLLEVEWEMMSNSFKSTSLGPNYDFQRCLESMDLQEEPMIIRREDQFPSPCTYVNVDLSPSECVFAHLPSVNYVRVWCNARERGRSATRTDRHHVKRTRFHRSTYALASPDLLRRRSQRCMHRTRARIRAPIEPG